MNEHHISVPMPALKTLGDYVRLARLHSSVLTGLTALFGALAIKPDTDLMVLMAIYFAGICVHIFGFVLNEYFDLEVDRHLEELSSKPLVSGAVTPGKALAFCLGSAAVSYIFILLATKFVINPWPFLFLTLTLAIFYAYDRWGKQLVITDLLLAGFVGFLCLAGASVIAWPVNLLTVVVASLAFLQLFLQNGLAGMKDVKHDMEAGAITTPIRLGVRINEDSTRITVSTRFKNYIIIFKIFHVFIIFGYIFYQARGDALNGLQLFLLIIGTVFMLSLMFKILTMRIFERDKLIRFIGAHEIVTYSLIPLLFIGILGWLSIFLLIIFPIIWLAAFMMLMYGRLLPQI
jgi:4-hydroxybenzoate polyprenyltransferase